MNEKYCYTCIVDDILFSYDAAAMHVRAAGKHKREKGGSTGEIGERLWKKIR